MTTEAQKNEQTVRHPAIILLAALQVIVGLQLIYTAASSYLLATEADPSTLETALIAKLPSALSQYTVQIVEAFGIIALLIGVLALFTAAGYLRGKERARIRGIRIAVIAIIIGIIGFVVLPSRLDVSSPFLTIMFNLAIILYLHSPNVRSYFRPRE
jgi:hypothetical protein